jgi:hypothetical protein
MSVRGRVRRTARLALFQNNQSLTCNLLNEIYHWRARRIWRKAHGVVQSEYAQMARTFAETGYHIMPSGPDPVFLRDLARKVDELFEQEPLVATMAAGLFRFKQGLELLPELEALITRDVDLTVQHYFRSYFKLYSVNVYRTVPTGCKADKSFQWHLDNCPRPDIKLMVYLDDVSEETGAFRLKPKPMSRSLIRQGFWDRNSIDPFRSILDDHTTTRVLEGPLGTSILFQDGQCVHKATHPVRGHRDVVTFVMMPSDVPWLDHLPRQRHRMSLNEGFCVNPFTDEPQGTVEYEDAPVAEPAEAKV